MLHLHYVPDRHVLHVLKKCEKIVETLVHLEGPWLQNGENLGELRLNVMIGMTVENFNSAKKFSTFPPIYKKIVIDLDTPWES